MLREESSFAFRRLHTGAGQSGADHKPRGVGRDMQIEVEVAVYQQTKTSDGCAQLQPCDAVFPDFAQINTLYNAIDLGEFSPEGPTADLDQLSQLEPAPAGTVRVGLIATMAWWKGHRDFIQALALIGESQPVRGYIVGGPVYQSAGSQTDLDELRAFTAKYLPQGRVGFTGFVDKPSSAIRALDIVVHASTRPEPFGRVIVEAMGCAKPVITTGIGGAAELITHHENALVFRGGDPAHLAEQIDRLARDPSLRQRLGAVGRIIVRQKFNRERLGPQLATIYRQVTGRTN